MGTGSVTPAPGNQPGQTKLTDRFEADEQIRRHVHQVFELFCLRPHGADRRNDRRKPFPYPIHITPISKHGYFLENETIVVLGKHLSEHGLDFYCQAPLPYRRVVASWECAKTWLAMVLDLRWCRSNRHGWYENGGRFLQVIDSPMGYQLNASGPARPVISVAG
ncbi:MAG: hypothetical protein ACODAD_05475 [Planctomycetota bacterium]